MEEESRRAVSEADCNAVCCWCQIWLVQGLAIELLPQVGLMTHWRGGATLSQNATDSHQIVQQRNTALISARILDFEENNTDYRQMKCHRE